jgi:hypothetical protein
MVDQLHRLGLVNMIEGGSRQSEVDWSRVAAPRPDLDDVMIAMRLFANRTGGRTRREPGETGLPSICDGAVALDYCYSDIPVGCSNAPRDHVNIAMAEEYLRRWPLGYRQFSRIIRSFHPVVVNGALTDASYFLQGSQCHSSQDLRMFGTMWSTINCPLMLAENFVHEAAHQKLFALGILKESSERIITNASTEGYRSPIITDRPRPMTALVHGVYSYMYVTALDIKIVEGERVEGSIGKILGRLKVNLQRLQDGIEEIRRFVQVDNNGELFFRGFNRWIDSLILRGHELLAVGSGDRHTVRVSHEALPVRIFVGTDSRQVKAERVLEHTIRKATSGPVEIVWMDHSRGGQWEGWNIGREHGALPQVAGPGWGTEFSCYRFAVPEAAGFAGRAIYLDSDMLVLRDLRELFEQPMDRPWLKTPNCLATLLIDCSYFRDKSWWPRIATMRTSAWSINDYLSLLDEHDATGTISNKWNCHDGKNFVPGWTAIVHYTARRTQPWKPYPELFDYLRHPSQETGAMWWAAYLEAIGQVRHSAAQSGYSAVTERSARHVELLKLYRRVHLYAARAELDPKDFVYWGGSLLPHIKEIRRAIEVHSARSLLDYGSGKGWQYSSMSVAPGVVAERIKSALLSEGSDAESIPEYWGVDRPYFYDPCYGPLSTKPTTTFDGVVCTDVLEHCCEAELEGIITEVFAFAKRFAYINVSDTDAGMRLPNGENAHCTVRPFKWWEQRIAKIAESYPAVAWYLRARGDQP